MKPSSHVVMSWSMGWIRALLMGSLISIGCGNKDSGPFDASRPPDASRPLDASRPPDANRPVDASQRPDANRPLDASLVDAAPFRCDSSSDPFEPNDAAGTAQNLPPYRFVSGRSATWFIDACTSSSNEDWYLFPSSTLGWDRDGDLTDVTMRLYFFARNANFCSGLAFCNGERLPSVPENTVTVEVYRASTMDLLEAETSEFGVVWLQGTGETFTEDFLIRISGPPEAIYDYSMVLNLSLTGSEDECEC